MTLDEQLLPFVWGIAQTYAVPLDAEPGDPLTEPLLYVLTTSEDELVGYTNAGRRNRDAHERRTEPFAAAFADTGLVRLQLINADTQQAPGPGRHHGLLLQTDDIRDADRQLLSMADEITAVEWTDRPEPQQHELATEVLLLEGDAPPLQFLVEAMIGTWAGPHGGRPA
ncbi:hypothetical protein [Segeticoccus rhizosphaerae]|uniref:hypothetical protein n=1 Tax=Segeticoccus rhizosphaerae TaxID=1104777 RepID=UPI00126579A7|nr:hypothetical protein [Segeticoccus rhizosphaerae]